MPLYLSWEQVALRVALACLASFVIGINRDEHGHPAGVRTTMLVCLAATLAMLLVNLLLPLAGKIPSFFVVMDLMRLPLGILSGIGFIGAGVIIKRDGNVSGVTTAATIWLVTVLDLLFGGGNLYLGIAGSLVTFVILWALKFVERKLSRDYHGSLQLSISAVGPTEKYLRQFIEESNLVVVHWKPRYEPASALVALECELEWTAPAASMPEVPRPVDHLRTVPGIVSLRWGQ
jgi:putative Mg2+ transporter-C (MgtC) family protein